MGVYQLTKKAESELAQIYEYSIENFGLAVAAEYLTGLYRTFEYLSDNPRMGRDCRRIRKRLRRHDHASHSVYYRITKSGVLILRVLGQSQDPNLQFRPRI
jgi:toxin ParE1/3/4